MGMAVRMNVMQFKQGLRAELEVLQKATRPAAQAGVQIIYDRARINVPVSSEAHKFHGTHQVYGPYEPGNLRDAIYQVFSKSKSYKDVSTYHVSWNKDEAPYGFMVELGTSHSVAQSFIGRSVAETRQQVREAIKSRYIEEVGKK